MKEKFLCVILMLIMVLSLASILPASLALADEDSASQETSSEVGELPSEPQTPTAISTEPSPTSGSCGDNVKWAFNKDTGVLTISGTGEMEIFYFDGFEEYPLPHGPWSSYNDYIKSINILNGVTSIEPNAFVAQNNLTSVMIGNSVTSIEEYAFYDCTSLTSVIIPKTVTDIGKRAFGFVHVDSSGSYAKVDNLKIYCYAGTAGEQYAKDNEFEYEILSDKENPPQNPNNNKNKPNQTVNPVNKAKITPSKGKKLTASKPAKIKEVKLTAKKKKLNVKWKKVSGATGYEVTYATNNKFTKNKKTVKVKKNKVTINKLKSKKKYYVKVRAYKKANGDINYGKWSKVIKKKTK